MTTSGKVGILAIDPGTTTGADCSVWDLDGTVGEAVLGRVGENRELRMGIEDQVVALGRMWVGLCEGNPELKCYLVIESYQQRPVAHMVPNESLDPVRVGSMLVGYLLGIGVGGRVMWQTAGLAKSQCTDARMKEWGGWIVGSDHRRDALRHAITARNRLSA